MPPPPCCTQDKDGSDVGMVLDGETDDPTNVFSMGCDTFYGYCESKVGPPNLGLLPSKDSDSRLPRRRRSEVHNQMALYQRRPCSSHTSEAAAAGCELLL